MEIERIYICTSLKGKLERIYTLQSSDDLKRGIFRSIEEDYRNIEQKKEELSELCGQALIDDIPYHISFYEIKPDDFLYEFKMKIEELLNDSNQNVIHFNSGINNRDELNTFNDNETFKFIAIKDDSNLLFLQIPTSYIIKNKSVLSFPGVNRDNAILEVPKGIQIPTIITASLDIKEKVLSVFDVNRFEQMLALNENKHHKAREVFSKYISKDYHVSLDKYHVEGLNDIEVQEVLMKNSRTLRRLSKFSFPEQTVNIQQVKEANEKLESKLQVRIDDENKVIVIDKDNAKTFVGIIYNIIVERLISGDVEVAI